jgi:hypothetical protein
MSPAARQIGAVTVTGHSVRVKVASGRFDGLARTVWQAAHGPIPRGYVVWHINLDRRDCRLANLQLLTRKEALRRQRQMWPEIFRAGSRKAGALAGSMEDARAAEQTRRAGVRKRLAAALAGLCPECRAILDPFWPRILKGLRVTDEFNNLRASAKSADEKPSAQSAEKENS